MLDELDRLESALNLAKEMHAKLVYLESNKKLVPAINLYKKYGFVEVPHDSNSPYIRSNIKMELQISDH